MLPVQFVFVAAGVNLIGTGSYLADTLRGRSSPNRVTWLLWAVIPLIGFVGQIQEGVGLQALMTFMIGFGPLLVFSASFVDRHAYVRITRFDIVCGGLSVLALVAWRLTGDGNVAIALSILGDFLAAIPTVRKAHRTPETETWTAYFCSGLSAAITILTITTWNFATAAFPVYILVMSTVMVLVVRLSPRGLRVPAAWLLALSAPIAGSSTTDGGPHPQYRSWKRQPRPAGQRSEELGPTPEARNPNTHVS